MAERQDLDDNNGDLIGRLTVFCECFVKTFEKKVNEIKEEEIIYDELSLIKDDKNFRKMLAFAAGEIFWCFQNQFILVTDRRNSVPMGMNILAFDGASRFFDYIYAKKQKKINNKTFCEFITEGIFLGKSKSRHIIKYQNKLYNTSELYEEVGILETNQDEPKKYHNRKGSSCEFSYRFPFSWENFNECLVKTYASGEEPIIPCNLTKNVLKEQLKNILKIINGEDKVWNIKKTTKNTTKILKKVDKNTLMVSNVDKNLNNIQPTIEDIHTDIIQVKADISELKQTIDTNKIIKNEATKNDQHKTEYVWFDMRKPVTTFTGRIEILETLHQTLHNANARRRAVISQTTSVSSLGGIGKSELSRKYAFQYEDAYDGNLIWINSETNESLKDSFVRLADQLNIPVKDKKIESIILNIYKEFGKGKSLFIFDNAEEYKIIKDFLPLCLPPNIQTPHILITSRNQKWQCADTGAMDVINLEYFTSNEALVFIKNALDIINNSTDDEIKTLAKELNYFPLALGQAVAYIKMKDIKAKKFRRETFGVCEYLKAYKDESFQTKLLEHRHENSQYNKTVLTTLNITLKNIKKVNKNSIKIIEIMAYLVPDSIKPDKNFPELMKHEEKREDVIDLISNKITKIMAYIFPDSIKPDVSLSELMKDKEKREDAIDLLLKYSMINIKDRVLSIHRLVQEVIRLQLKESGKETDVLKNVLKLLGFDLDYVDVIHLLSVWSYASDYGEIIDEFFFKYKNGDKKTTPFHLIVKSDNIDAVKKILNHLKKKSNEKLQKILNSTKYHYETPLEISIWENNLEMTKVLIEFGAKKETKICVETIFNCQLDLVKCIYPNNDECLLHAKFYSALRSENVESLNNLLKDLKKDQIKNLIEQKITNVDPKLINERAPLLIAAKSGNLDLVKLLFINYGADINFSCDWGTSLHAAVRNNHLEIFKFLIENGAIFNPVDCYGQTVLHLAAFWGHLEFVKYSIENNKCDINATDKEGRAALHLATEQNKLEVVKYLIQNKKCDINATDSWGRTALHYATQYGRLELVKYLIENNKCDINATDKLGTTALKLATKRNKLKVAEYLTKIINERK